PAAVGADDVVTEGEAEPRAADRARVRRVDAEEPREDRAALVLRDPQPGIGDRNPDVVSGRLGGDAERAAVRRVLDRVRAQVRDDLGGAVALAQNLDRLVRPRQLDRVLLALPREELGFLAQELGELEGLERELEAALLDALQIEELVDQVGEPPRL